MKNILTSTGWAFGTLESGADGTITGIHAESCDSPVPGQGYILPGFIDLHVHGAGGFDFMEGEHAADVIATTHARTGTTAFLATTMTAPEDKLRGAMAALGAVENKVRPPQCARLLGIHLEGPFLNPDKLGAQPRHARPAVLVEIEELLKLATVRVVTLAPEIEGHLETIHTLVKRGIRVQLGHSKGTYEQGVAAIQCGASGFAHLFNAMSSLHHRSPGLVGTALAHAEYAELIPDLLHVHPAAVRAAFRAIPKLYCVTDSCSAVGMPEGEYSLGAQRVFLQRCLQGVRLADGTLAASTLTMDVALRNLVSLGMPINDASNRVSRYPADFLGLQDRGRLTPGAWADYVVLDQKLNIEEVWIEGRSIDTGPRN
ncbi:N-acetylglucosamine-6-phosphate deacetylase [Burkholderia sp. 572]|uniref:N-acetylglucosamine-6-phosphate deacetylase n=1 Tax=Burkholderia sp. 572 TaxID=3156414 RepID=UPI003393C6CE